MAASYCSTIGLQKIPDTRMRIGEIDVAAPDPAAALCRPGPDQAGRLRIMDHDQVFVKFHALAVLLVVRHENVFDLPWSGCSRRRGARCESPW